MEIRELGDIGLDFDKYEYWFPWMPRPENTPKKFEVLKAGRWTVGKYESKTWTECLRRWLKPPAMRHPTKADLLASGGFILCQLIEDIADQKKGDWVALLWVSDGLATGDEAVTDHGVFKLNRLAIQDVHRWKPNLGELFWIVSSLNCVASIWSECDTDRELYVKGNCFKTEEEARRAYRWLFGSLDL